MAQIKQAHTKLHPFRSERWRVQFHVDDALPSWPCPLNVTSGFLMPGIRVGGKGTRNRPPHTSLVVTLEGEARLAIAGREHVLTPGTGFVCRYPDPEHVHYVPDNGEGWRNLFIDWTGCEAMVDDLTNTYGHVFRLPEAASITHRLLEFKQHNGQMLELPANQGSELVLSLLHEAYQYLRPKRTRTRQEELVSRARKLIYANAQTGVNVSELAAMLEVTPEHLCRIVRTQTGRTPQQHVATERARAACSLLENTLTTCEDIAEQLGFCSVGSFGKAFKKIMGVSPSKYRSACRQLSSQHNRPPGNVPGLGPA